MKTKLDRKFRMYENGHLIPWWCTSYMFRGKKFCQFRITFWFIHISFEFPIFPPILNPGSSSFCHTASKWKDPLNNDFLVSQGNKLVWAFLFHFIFVYLKSRIMERGEEKVRQTDREREPIGGNGLGLFKEPGASSGSPSTWPILCCFARCISRYLDWKWSNCDSSHMGWLCCWRSISLLWYNESPWALSFSSPLVILAMVELLTFASLLGQMFSWFVCLLNTNSLPSCLFSNLSIENSYLLESSNYT